MFVDEGEWLAHRFEESRPHLRAVAYRMLGSLAEADDAVQESWLRLSRADSSDVENLSGWLTTVVARVCLDMLRSRRSRREEPLVVEVPELVISADEATDPEQEALLAESVGLALFVVLNKLAPAERVAFVLHDMFAVPFEEIAAIVGRSANAARLLASRARRRVQETVSLPDVDLARQQAAVDAFFAAARGGDFEALLAILDPDVVIRADFGTAAGAAAPRRVAGARAVAGQATTFSRIGRNAHLALVNGVPGAVITERARPFAVMSFTVEGDRITAIDLMADPARLRHLDLAELSQAWSQ